MTRQEFIDSILEFDDLIPFCEDRGLSQCENIYSRSDFDTMIDRDIEQFLEDRYWCDLRDWLNIIPDCEWYEKCYDDWDEPDFEHVKESVLREMDGRHLWDDSGQDEESDDAQDGDNIITDEEFQSVLQLV